MQDGHCKMYRDTGSTGRTRSHQIGLVIGFRVSGQETERVHSYNPGARTGRANKVTPDRASDFRVRDSV